MTVLVSAASRHGSTMEIAEHIGRTLRETCPGLHVEVVPADQVRSIEGYRAVVLGSAVYLGRWLEPARHLVDANAAVLSAVPVWLFSSGPIGDPPKPVEEPADGAAAATTVGAVEHRVFAGRLDKHGLGFAEKAVTRAVRAPEGDFRDWAAVTAWAAGIASALDWAVIS